MTTPPPYFGGADTPTARLFVGDAAQILAAHGRQWHSIVTGLPDAAETTMDIPTWSRWFQEMVTVCTQSIDPDGVAVFAQTDRLSAGRWISKADLVHRALRAAGAKVLWHKIAIVQRGTVIHRPGYTHIIAGAYRARPGRRTPDTVDAGLKIYPNALGSAAVDLIYQSIDHIPADVIGDPFVGRGSILEGAVARGRSVVGVDIDPDQVAAAAITLNPYADVTIEHLGDGS